MQEQYERAECTTMSIDIMRSSKGSMKPMKRDSTLLDQHALITQAGLMASSSSKTKISGRAIWCNMLDEFIEAHVGL